MAMYRCANCGRIFDEEEAKVVNEHVGDFWGAPAYQSFIECPDCGDDCLDELTAGEVEIYENIENGNTESSKDGIVCPCCGTEISKEDDDFYEYSKNGVHTCPDCENKFVLKITNGTYNTEVYYE